MANKITYITIITAFCVGLTAFACPPPPCTTPEAFSLLSPANLSPIPFSSKNNVTLSWASSSYADGYYIYLDSNSTPTTYRGSTSSTSWPVPSGLLQSDTTYYWRIRAYNSGGSCSTTYRYSSGIYSFKITSETGPWYVKQDGDNDANGLSWETAFETIQMAIDSASEGHEIMAACGDLNTPAVYYEQLDMKGKSLDVHSEDPNGVLTGWDLVESTIIDANSLGRVVTFTGAEDANSVLSGFTITGGGYSLTSSPQAHWELNNDPNDSSGNGYHGTLYGNPVWDPNGSLDGCVDLDGDGDYVEIAHNSGLSAFASLTIAAWVFPVSGISNYDIIINKENEYEMAWKDNQLVCAIKTDTNNWFWTSGTGTNTLPTGQWTHVAVAWDGSYIYEYINGVLKKTTAQSGNTTNLTTNPLHIGRRSSGAYWNGKVDDVQIYDVALCGDDILKYGGGIQGYGTSATISECIIKDNRSGTDGGGISNVDGQISNCFIINNESDADGGGLADCDGDIINCVIADNTADNAGAILGGDSNSEITNCTIANNAADVSVGGVKDCNSVITNTILWGNTDADPNTNTQDAQISGGVPTVNYSCIQDGTPGATPYPFSTGTGNIDDDPALTSDYHLSFGSPCIDTGDPNGVYTGQTDIDGDDRMIGDDVNMGCDETLPIYNLDQGNWYRSIQSAIDGAASGDKIGVYPGTYNENIDFSGKAITLRSVDPNDWDVVEATIIDGGGSGSVVTFDTSEDANSVLTGFTITNGCASDGSGIVCKWASPTISNCIVRDNDSGESGGGISCISSDAIIENCVIHSNDSLDGGGIYCENSDAIIENCIIHSNDAEDDAGGILLLNADITIDNCTIADNHAGYGGGLNNHSSYPTITNTIFWDNEAVSSGDQVYKNSGSPYYSYCDIEGCGGSGGGWDSGLGTDGGGNIDSDPNFVDAANDDYHLSSGSPCIDVGDPNGVYTGQTDIDGQTRVFGGRIDIGADEVTEISINNTDNPWDYDTASYDANDILPGTKIVQNEGYECLVLPMAALSSTYEINHHEITVNYTGTGTCKISLGHSSSNNVDNVAATYYLTSPFTQVSSGQMHSVVSPYKNEHYSWLFIYIQGDVNIQSVDYEYWMGEGTLYGHTAQTYEFAGRDLPYRIMFPKNYDPNEKYPLVISVHGSLGVGTNNYSNMELSLLSRYLFTDYLDNPNMESISIVPQIPPFDGNIPEPYYPTGSQGEPVSPEHPDWPAVNENGWYNQACLGLIYDLITSSNVSADPDRVYFTGFSYGGKACWEFLKSDSDLFAGAMSCGGWPIGRAYSNPLPDLYDALVLEVERYVQVPVSIFVGGQDNMRYGSHAVHEEITFQGGDSTLTIFDGVTHNGSGVRTYSNSTYVQWLFEQNLQNRPDLELLVRTSVEEGISISPIDFTIDAYTNPADTTIGTRGYTIVTGDDQTFTISADPNNDTELFVDGELEGFNIESFTLYDVTCRHDIVVKVFERVVHASAENGAIIEPSGEIIIEEPYSDLTFTITAPVGRTAELFINGVSQYTLPEGMSTYLLEDITEDYEVEVRTMDAILPGTSKQYQTIQDAINDANVNNVVEVLPGTYVYDLDYGGKPITVCSSDPDDPEVVASVVIKGTVRFDDGETGSSVLSGLTIQNPGYYGIYCEQSSPTISQCVIKNKTYGIYIDGGSPVISQCVIQRNSRGIEIDGGSPVISQCVIEKNSYRGVIFSLSSPVISNNMIYDNGFCSIYGDESNPVIRSNLISGCQDGGRAGKGIHLIDPNTATEISNNTIVNNDYGIYTSGASGLPIQNCILWENGQDLFTDNGTISVTYSCIEDCNEVGDPNTTYNTCSDPLFVKLGSDYHILSESPCRNTGDPNGVYTGQTDIDGEDRVIDERVDMGADEDLNLPYETGTYSGGSGDPNDPYLITDANDWVELTQMPSDWSACFELTTDIDLSDVNNLSPVGTLVIHFTGVFDGNDFVVSNAMMDLSGSSNVGLFGRVGADGVIRNLGVEDVNVIGNYSVGGLVGYAANNCTISNCYATGTVETDDYAGAAGGLVGYAAYCTISNCYATGYVYSDNEYCNIGGLVGHMKSGCLISECYATGTVENDGPANYGCAAGGLVGYVEESGCLISECYATGNVKAYEYAGGLVGCSDWNLTVSDCYATGNVEGNYYTGGLAGFFEEAIVSNCYATGYVYSDYEYSCIGGFAGAFWDCTVSNCFWNTETSETTVGVYEDSSSGVTGRTTAQMQTESNFTNAGWDFVGETTNGTDDIWMMSGYPHLPQAGRK
jgi:parallel beta-helix repeat protein